MDSAIQQFNNQGLKFFQSSLDAQIKKLISDSVKLFKNLTLAYTLNYY